MSGCMYICQILDAIKIFNLNMILEKTFIESVLDNLHREIISYEKNKDRA